MVLTWLFFFRRNLRKTLKLIHKLAWTVGCQNPKFQNFAQSILASTTFVPKHYQNREKVRKTPVLPIVQTGQTQALARSRLAVLFWWLIRRKPILLIITQNSSSWFHLSLSTDFIWFFHFSQIGGFEHNFSNSFGKILKLRHKLACTVGCQNSKPSHLSLHIGASNKI